MSNVNHTTITTGTATYPLIFSKMVAVMRDIGHIGKDQKNTAQGFKFRGIDQFVNALHPALIKHGVFMTTKITSFNQELKEVVRSSGKAGTDKHIAIVMEYTFHAEDGSSVSSTVPAEGVDSGDKATNKALSAALKYALIQTFSIPTEDMAEADLESPVLGTAFKGEKSNPTQENAPGDLKLAEAPAEQATKVASFRKPKAAATTPTGGGWK